MSVNSDSLSLQNVINSQYGVGLALWLGRVVPPRLGYPLANSIAAGIARQRSNPMVQAVRFNQWVVSGEQLSGAALDRAVVATFQHTGRCLYDLYHNLNNPAAFERLVEFSPAMEGYIKLSQQGKQGVVFAAPHLSNFDFVGRAVVMRGLSAQVLSIADPHRGYQWQNELRKKFGIEITPISTATLRQATARLEAGGSVITGIDRPFPGAKYEPRFFGRPAPVPVGHVRLALKAHVPVVVVTALMRPDGIYQILASDPISMQPDADHNDEILLNTEAVLKVVEAYISQAPHQWAMFYPVWPSVQIASL